MEPNMPNQSTDNNASSSPRRARREDLDAAEALSREAAAVAAEVSAEFLTPGLHAEYDTSPLLDNRPPVPVSQEALAALLDNRAAVRPCSARPADGSRRMALPCIVCGAELESVSATDPVQPYEAVTFRAHGQYGSTVFDPQDQSQLYINICDKCLAEKGRAGVVWHACYEQRPAIVRFERRWDPDTTNLT